MSDDRAVRIFISSPVDMRPERLKAEQIIARLDREFAYRFRVESVLWEREPLVATHHFQDPENIPPPRTTDIVVVILWSRLGLMLPEEERFRGAVSGRLPVTGTEWEFEDALAGARDQDGVPRIMVFRKTAEPEGRGVRQALLERADQLGMVDDFLTRWSIGGSGDIPYFASSNFETTTEFQDKLYDQLRELLERRAGASAMGIKTWHEAPFRALLSYEYEHEPVFRGRTRARNEVRELLARRIDAGVAFVLVLGASGSGKSSLVKAGLVPELALPGMIGRVALVRRAVMRPSDVDGGPLAALAAAILSATALPELASLQYTPDQLAALLRDAPGQAALPIRQGLVAAGKAAQPPLMGNGEARLVIVVDQLEEMFTIDRCGQSDREAFVAALKTLAESRSVWVIATMRSDFFDRLETMAPLAALSADAQFLLLPPDGAEIGQIIRQPAREAGLRFEHDAPRGLYLDEVIQQAAAEQQGALPLLSFLLDQLWQRRSEAGELTFAAYDEIGGFEGALGRRAEGVFQAQPQFARDAFIPLLRELVSIEGGKPVSRTAPLSRFPAKSPQRALVDAFLAPEARLLVADRGQLRLAHEALLSHWPRVREQIANDTRDLELRGRLEQEAERWRTAQPKEKPGRVITGLPLAEARALLARWRDDLPGEISEFIAASRRAARHHRIRLAGLVASAPLAVALIAVVVWAGMVWWGVRQVEADMAFVPIAAGCFEMGSSDKESGRDPNEGPLHRVCLKAFEIGKFEVTQDEWRSVMIFPPPHVTNFTGSGRLPVEMLNWYEARRFLWLMSLFGHDQYRLLSESEWEYAARAGTTTRYHWGDNINDGCVYENIADQSLRATFGPVVANCNDGHASTAPVGSFKPNPWGLYDMLGNVTTWVEDCYVATYDHAPIDGSPVEGTCVDRVFRGGSWDSTTRAAKRGHFAPDNRARYIGLRVARTITP
jgi:formylglycine-generating enzyme required for sulfatase activity